MCDVEQDCDHDVCTCPSRSVHRRLEAIADAIMRLPVSQHESQEAEAVAQRV